jgi:hypothetical protein
MKVQQHRIKYYVLGFYLLLLTVWQGLFSAQVLPDYRQGARRWVTQRA